MYNFEAIVRKKRGEENREREGERERGGRREGGREGGGEGSIDLCLTSVGGIG